MLQHTHSGPSYITLREAQRTKQPVTFAPLAGGLPRVVVIMDLTEFRTAETTFMVRGWDGESHFFVSECTSMDQTLLYQQVGATAPRQ